MFASKCECLIKRVLSTNSLRTLATKSKTCQEVRIPVPWGHVAGKWWGPTDIRPILSLHGWQDNCGTFDRLIPLLNDNVGYLAIDFPGHGLSSRLPPGLYYHFTNYIILVQHIYNYFQWSKISLMGHSLGGITSYIYSMIYPDNVDFLVCIDGAKPMIRNNNNVYMGRTIQNFFRYDRMASGTNEPPSYTLDEIKEKVCQPNENSVALEYSHYLIERNIAPSKIHPGKYYFTRDPRLKSGGLLNYPQNELVEQAQNMVFPMFIAKATKGSYYEAKANFYEVLDVLKRSSKDCDFNYVEGTHHVHLNNPENVAELLVKFIKRHDIEDRSVGGLRKEMVG